MAVRKYKLPKFLTRRVARRAIQTALAAVQSPALQDTLKSGDSENITFHVVILVPKKLLGPGIRSEAVTERHPLFEYTHGDRGKWPLDYAKIARSKAFQHWRDCSADGTDIIPHLLFSEETPFWGSVKQQGIVVACSGVQSHFDRLIASIIAATCIALAHEKWMQSKEKRDGSPFLS